MALGLKTTFTPLLGSPIDLTPDLRSVEVIWPATTGLPSVIAEFANGPSATNEYARIQSLAGNLAINFPGELAAKTFNLYVEEPVLAWDKTKGDICTFNGTAAPELLFSYEGLLSVVGTDLTAPYWNNLTTTFTPYLSTFVPSLETNLMSVDSALTALIHTQYATQNQPAAYRGRLNYEMGYGIPLSGIDYTPGSLGGGPLYVKAMWTVGQGSQGAQKTGVDVLTSLLSANIIDATGTPQMIDYFVDMTQTPAKLVAFERAFNNSNVTIVRGVDPVEAVNLPYSSKDIRNIGVYFGPPETQYPNSGDAWSNYDTAPHFTGQWPISSISSGSGVQGFSSDVPAGQLGTSNEYSAAGGATWSFVTTFDLGINNYAYLNSAARGLTNFDFWFKRLSAGAGDTVSITFADGAGNSAGLEVFNSGSPPSAGVWHFFQVGIPASGLGTVTIKMDGTNWLTGQNYTVLSGSWNFATAVIASVAFGPPFNISASNSFLLDQIHFEDNWNFSPAYSWNPNGPSVTKVKTNTSVGATSLPVQTIAGLVVGQYITIAPFTGNQERHKIAALASQSISFPALDTLQFNQNAGVTVIGGTDDPTSIAAFGPRPYPYSDFYLASGNSDTADAIAMSIINQRKAKKTTGTIRVSGYQSGIASILPGYIFNYVDPKTIYAPLTGNLDSVITGFMADSIRYVFDPLAEAFYAEFTVEPWYANILLSSPDTNAKNIQRIYNMSPAGQISRLNRATQKQGVPY
jgi:hypothetical protein